MTDTTKSQSKAEAGPKPLVSIVIPVFNAEKWLDACIASVRGQSLKDIEILLVDDGSTDGSAKLCRAAATADPRVKYHQQPNAGPGAARKKGVAVSKGGFVTFVDSDDTVHPEFCRELYDAISSSGADVATAMIQDMDEAGTLTTVQDDFGAQAVKAPSGADFSDAEKVLGVYASPQANGRLIRRTLFDNGKLAGPARVPHDGWFVTHKAFALAKAVCYVAEPLYFMRRHTASFSAKASEAHIDAAVLLLSETQAIRNAATVTDRQRGLAERRLLLSLGAISDHLRTASADLKAKLILRLVDSLPHLTRTYQGVDRDYISKDMLVPAARLIEEISAKRNEQVFASNEAYVATKEKFSKAPTDRDRVLSLRNAFAGQRCFIIGNGPSLNKHDMTLLEDEYTFAVNSFFLKTRDTGFCPTFYVVEDSKVMEDNVDDIRAYPAPFKFFPEDYKPNKLESDATCYFKMNWDFYFKSRPYNGIPRFSTTMHDYIFAGQTVTFANMQIAFYMGFTEVYLIGMDFDYFLPPEHIINGNHILSTTDDPNHFHKDYFGAGKTWKDPQLGRVAMSYRQGKLIFEAAGRGLYNATVGGKLEIFDRVDFETLLRDPETGEKRTVRAVPTTTSIGNDANLPVQTEVSQLKVERERLKAYAAQLEGKLANAGLSVPEAGSTELDQLRESFKSLSAIATDLEQQVNVAGSAAKVAEDADLLDRLQDCTNADSARLFLTAVGTGLLLNAEKMQARLKSNPRLGESVSRALALLAPDDAHKVHFLRVQGRFGPVEVAALQA